MPVICAEDWWSKGMMLVVLDIVLAKVSYRGRDHRGRDHLENIERLKLKNILRLVFRS